jgi:ABC-type glycerol-3-phosphate transport system substrate-binding protein
MFPEQRPEEQQSQDRLLQRSVSRRQMLRTLVIASGGAALAACVGSTPAPAAQSTSTSASPLVSASSSAVTTSEPAKAATSTVKLLTGGWPFNAMPTKEDIEKSPASKAYAEVLQAWLDQNPGVTVEKVETSIWSQQDLVTAIAGGTAPSAYPGLVLGNYRTDATRAAFVQGLAADITPLVNGYQTNSKVAEYAQPLWSTWNVDNKYYAAPGDYNVGVGIYYRRDLIQEAGLKEPEPGWTWDDFRALAKGLAKGNVKGAALQTWGIGWLLSANGFEMLTKLPAPETDWNWKWDYTSLATIWASAISRYRGMVFEDQSVLTDQSYQDDDVAKAFRNGNAAMISNNTGFLMNNPDDPASIVGLANSLNKSTDDVFGWVSHPVGDTGMFGTTQPQVVLVSFSPDLKGEELDKAYSLFDYLTFGEGYIKQRQAAYELTKDVRRAYTDVVPLNGITTFDGVPGSADEAWGKKFTDAVRAAAAIPLVPASGLYIPPEKNTGPTGDAINDAQSRWSFETGNLDIAAGFSSSVADNDFIDGATKYYAALDEFWKKNAPEFYEKTFKPWYAAKVLPALNK